MRIGVDGCLATFSDGGVGAYTTNIVNALAALGLDEVIAFVPTWAQRHVALEPRADGLVVEVLADDSRGGYHERRLRWQEGELAQRLQRRDVDVLLAPVFTFPSSWDGPAVVAVHDLAFERDEQHNTPASAAFYRDWARPCAARAAAIVTPSEVTRRDVEELWDVRDKPVHVVHLAPSLAFVPPEKAACQALVARELGLGDPYVLLVGDVNPRKNIARAVRAFALLCDEEIVDRLDLVAVRARSEQLTGLAESLGLARRVRFVDYCLREHMPYLYGGAEAFVYPSVFEGFGMPPLEAMLCGAPVGASAAGALPEVLGDSALLFDPLDVAAIARAMRRLVTDEALRRELVERGRERASRFTWEQTAQQTRAVLAQAA